MNFFFNEDEDEDEDVMYELLAVAPWMALDLTCLGGWGKKKTEVHNNKKKCLILEQLKELDRKEQLN